MAVIQNQVKHKRFFSTMLHDAGELHQGQISSL
jgi:hypothetical protein